MCLAIPARIVKTVKDGPLGHGAVVDFGGVRKEISLAFVPEAAVGDFVIVHVGFALSIVDEKEAARVFRYLDEAEVTEELGE